jgi:predicted GIY-YIG superfamily endonuclease
MISWSGMIYLAKTIKISHLWRSIKTNDMKTYTYTKENFYNKYQWHGDSFCSYDGKSFEYGTVYIPKQGLYILLNEGEIVYIGFSLSLQQRIKSHSAKSSKKIWTDVVMIEMLEDTKESIMHYEKELISKYKPKYNILT